MSELYDQEFVEITVSVLDNDLTDLEAWSAQNEDKYINQIAELRKLIDEIKLDL